MSAIPPMIVAMICSLLSSNQNLPAFGLAADFLARALRVLRATRFMPKNVPSASVTAMT